jgi:transposase-like protein
MDTRKKEKIKNDTPAEERKSNRERRETQQEGKIPFPGSSCTRTPESEFITKTRKKRCPASHDHISCQLELTKTMFCVFLLFSFNFEICADIVDAS